MNKFALSQEIHLVIAMLGEVHASVMSDDLEAAFSDGDDVVKILGNIMAVIEDAYDAQTDAPPNESNETEKR